MYRTEEEVRGERFMEDKILASKDAYNPTEGVSTPS